MQDRIIRERIRLIVEGIEMIEFYCVEIHNKEDFNTVKAETQKTLDAVMMRLQIIGENIKKIENIQPGYFDIILQYDVTPVIRFRDFISHHYEKLDYEIIYEIISIDIPLLKEKLHLHNK